MVNNNYVQVYFSMNWTVMLIHFIEIYNISSATRCEAVDNSYYETVKLSMCISSIIELTKAKMPNVTHNNKK